MTSFKGELPVKTWTAGKQVGIKTNTLPTILRFLLSLNAPSSDGSSIDDWLLEYDDPNRTHTMRPFNRSVSVGVGDTVSEAFLSVQNTGGPALQLTLTARKGTPFHTVALSHIEKYGNCAPMAYEYVVGKDRDHMDVSSNLSPAERVRFGSVNVPAPVSKPKVEADNKPNTARVQVASTLTVHSGKSRTPGKKLRYDVLRRDDFRCRKCGATAKDTQLHVDHIIPWSKGGKTVFDNLQTLCSTCNLGKGDRIDLNA